MNTLTTIDIWHRRARPEPTPENFNVQLGCHLEEIEEMLSALTSADLKTYSWLVNLQECVTALASQLKSGIGSVQIIDRCGFLDSLADQVVTAVGVGHCAGMNVPTACERVDQSNWSKFVDGQPIFNEHGKIAKGENYAPPDLEDLY